MNLDIKMLFEYFLIELNYAEEVLRDYKYMMYELFNSVFFLMDKMNSPDWEKINIEFI